jgi:hypothetical protein
VRATSLPKVEPLLGGTTPITPRPTSAPPNGRRLSLTASLTGSLTANIDVKSLGAEIQHGFVGFSIEWGAKYEGVPQGGPQHYVNATSRFVAAFAPFGRRKIIRVGGFSTEALTGVPPQETWDGLKALIAQAGFKVRAWGAQQRCR